MITLLIQGLIISHLDYYKKLATALPFSSLPYMPPTHITLHLSKGMSFYCLKFFSCLGFSQLGPSYFSIHSPSTPSVLPFLSMNLFCSQTGLLSIPKCTVFLAFLPHDFLLPRVLFLSLFALSPTYSCILIDPS